MIHKLNKLINGMLVTAVCAGMGLSALAIVPTTAQAKAKAKSVVVKKSKKHAKGLRGKAHRAKAKTKSAEPTHSAVAPTEQETVKH